MDVPGTDFAGRMQPETRLRLRPLRTVPLLALSNRMRVAAYQAPVLPSGTVSLAFAGFFGRLRLDAVVLVVPLFGERR